MKLSIKTTIYQAISEEHWLEIKYKNQKEEETFFYIGINDIDINSDKLFCEIFNSYKSNECLEKPSPIKLSGIIYARVLEQSYYPTSENLMKKIDNNGALRSYLEADKLDNDILRYLEECYKLDNDPYIKDKGLIDGVDTKVLLKEKKYQLDDNQFTNILTKIFKADFYDSEDEYRFAKDLGINLFSIDIKGKQYVVAYYSLGLNFKDKTLSIRNKILINKSFLISDGKRATLSQYLDIDPDEFENDFVKKPREFIDLIKENFRYGEKVDTSPEIFVLERSYQAGVGRTFEEIYRMQQENALTFPLKSFFGRNRPLKQTKKETNIVVFDKNKINIDQMRVVYNSMINHATYVKGPPGTGKTETIFNVLLSAYYNDMKVLVCSNNNIPVNDINKKMRKSLHVKEMQTGEQQEFIFPIIRLGNNEQLEKTLKFLISVLEYVNQNKNKNYFEELTLNQKERSLTNFQHLKKLLEQYEERIDIEEKIEKLKKISLLNTSNRISKEIGKQISLQMAKLNAIPDIKNEDVTKYSVSANEDSNFQNFVYYSSLGKLKKILSPTNKELVEILKMGVNEESIARFNKYLRDDTNLRRFTDIFPIVVTTNISSDKLGSPKQHFDLCIMDEAAQCNVAVSLIPIVRADNLLLVGDTNQLQPVTTIETDINEKLIEKYHIKKEYNYMKNSILSTMLSKDNNSKSILLSYHYRCGRKIAGFVNSRFYENQLKLFNKNNGNLLYLNVKNTKIPDTRNAYVEEAKAIVNIIKQNNYNDVGIVTPFRNQAYLINEYLRNEGIKLNDVSAGTIHTLQGSERSVIIMSSALSTSTAKRTMERIKNNHELINVAVTRAKDTFIFAGDKQAIDALSGKEVNDIKALSDYVANSGLVEAPASNVRISTDFSNNSAGEKVFFDTITPYFTRRGSKLRIERNVSVSTAIKGISKDDLTMIGRKEFDVIVQAGQGGFLTRPTYRTILVFEIDGGEHIGSTLTAQRDRIKEQVCSKYGIKMIRISNNDVKDYQLIISLFESIIKGIPDLDDVSEQLSLFDFDN